MKENKGFVKVVIVLMSLSQGLQFSISPVLQKVQENYPGISVSRIQMLVTAPTVLAMGMALLSGWLITKISKKKLVMIGCFILGVSGFIPLLNESFTWLLGSRLILGIGLGLVMALNTAVVAEHFQGNERIAAMGLQGASVGAGMLLVNMGAGALGEIHYSMISYMHLIGIVATIGIAALLPETGRVVVENNQRIRINAGVLKIALLGCIAFIFIISFSTNISLLLEGPLKGNTSLVGIIAGIFSGVQILIGMILTHISKRTKSNTLFVGMLSFSLGAFLLFLFPGNTVGLIIGAVFCGIAQGIFVPRAMYEVASIVPKEAAALSAAVLTVGITLGQFLSPVVLNTTSLVVFGQVNSRNVYLIGAIVMGVVPLALMAIRRRSIHEVPDRC